MYSKKPAHSPTLLPPVFTDSEENKILSNSDSHKLFDKRVKMLSMYLMGSNMMNHLNIIVNQLDKGDQTRKLNIPPTVFSWSMKDTLTRRDIHIMWCQLLVKHTAPDLLQIHKLSIDIENIKKYAQMILTQYLKIEPMAEVMKEIQLSEQLLTLDQTLRKEFEINNAKYMDYIYNIFGRRLIPQDTGKSPSHVYNMITEATIDQDIYNRYFSLYFENETGLVAHKMKTHEELLEHTINEQLKKTKVTESTMNNILCVHYTQIELYKYRIKEMSRVFSEQDEEVSSKSFNLQKNLEDITIARTYYTEQIHRFHQEKLLMLKREARMQELENEAMANAALRKHQRKAKSATKKRK